MTESWFGNLRWKPRKGVSDNEKEVLGVLALEVVTLMSRIVSLWSYLSDGEIVKLKEQILNSVGVEKLVADDEDYLLELALNELLHNFGVIARSVARLSRKCIDPVFVRFEHFFSDPVKYGLVWMEWEYRLKKMERKVKKMERFIAITMQLSEELEVLAELDQSLRRMKANPELQRGKLLEFQQRITLQRQVVKSLREMSPWVRTYDYTVRLLARSLLTILGRIRYAFTLHQLASAEGNNHQGQKVPDFLPRARSFSASMPSSVHPIENVLPGGFRKPTGSSAPKLGLTSKKNRVSDKQQDLDHHSSTPYRRKSSHKTNQLAPVGPMKICLLNEFDSPILNSCKPPFSNSMRHSTPAKRVDKVTSCNMGSISCNSKVYLKLALFSSKSGLLKAPSSTLGDAALALHYANMIILIEKLISSPHVVDIEVRDDLYFMLPTTIKAALRCRLKKYSKSLALFLYDASLAAEWSLEVEQILEWLSPIAHNTVRWHSEQNFEREQEVSRTNVLLVQTLHFANQAKAEAAITELLVGLNYICRFNGQLKINASPE